ncbi:MAG: site-specific integrase [Dysosmobacter sp.]
MAAFYGLRRSGIMGLRWSAIDFEGNTLTVDHTVVQYRSDGKNRMKNKSSCRTMPPVPQYRELLLRMQERKAACKEFCGNCYTESEYIYVNELGIPYKPNFVSDHFKRVLKQHGLRPIRFHDFRYTCASLLLKNGVAVKDIQDWLGLSSYATNRQYLRAPGHGFQETACNENEPDSQHHPWHLSRDSSRRRELGERTGLQKENTQVFNS